MPVLTVVKRHGVVCTLAVLTTAVLLFISERSYVQSMQSLMHVAASQAGRTRLRDLHIDILDAETAQRGYLLTQHALYLEPYAGAIKDAQLALDELDRYYAGDASVQQAMATLRAAVQAKLDELAQTIRLHDTGQRERAAAIVASNVGEAQMQSIRVTVAELLAHDEQLRDQKRAAIEASLSLSRAGVAALSFISLLALYMYLRFGLAARTHEQDLKRVAQLERERLEVEVRERTSQLTDLTRHLLSAREDERNRLARDLHDELGSLLTSAKLDAARIKSRLGGAAPEVLERLAHLVDTLNSGIALGRRIIEDLRPSTLANLGLVSALEILAREFGERSGLAVHCALETVRLSPSAELVVYRLVQEAFTNLSKYAKAREVWVSLAARDGLVQASVRDDGVGFDTTVAPSSAYGLLGMRYRAEAEQGTLAVASVPGQGTKVQMTLPQSS